MNLNNQLGAYVAEYIIATQLPTLSTDMLKTSYVIDVPETETLAWKEKDAKWFSICHNKSKEEESSKLFYENLKWYYSNIKEVYLPETLKIQVPRVSPTNMKQFEEGFKHALWDCDRSDYWVEDGWFQQTQKGSWCSYIVLTRSKINLPEKFA